MSEKLYSAMKMISAEVCPECITCYLLFWRVCDDKHETHGGKNTKANLSCVVM